MRTISVLGIIYLPGTFVATFFSMDMFDWNAKEGNQIASKWLWIYFVVSIPLTVAILILWWMWTQQSDKISQGFFRTTVGRSLNGYHHEDHMPPTNNHMHYQMQPYPGKARRKFV